MFTNVNNYNMEKRFKKWMDSKGISAIKLAANINVSRAAISHILSGRNKPSIDILNKILKEYSEFNLNWLISGVGQMSNNFKTELIKKKNVKKVMVFYDDASFDEVSN